MWHSTLKDLLGSGFGKSWGLHNIQGDSFWNEFSKKISSIIIYILVYLMNYVTLQHTNISYSSSVLLAIFFIF